MTTVNDFVDILRIIREQPEWADALRSALLSKEVLELPQRLAEFAETTNRRLGTLEEGQTRLEAGQARLEAGQAKLEGRLDNLEAGQAKLEAGQVRLEARLDNLESGHSRLEGAVGNLRGSAYEQKVANNIATIIRRPLSIRRVRLLKGHGATRLDAFLMNSWMLRRTMASSVVRNGSRQAVRTWLFRANGTQTGLSSTSP